MKRLFWVFLLSLFLSSLPLPTSAQDGSLRLTTSPLPLSLTAEPGTTVSTDLKVKNAGTEPETLTIDILKFKAYEDSGKPELMDPDPTDDSVHWVNFSEPTFTVLPEEWKTIKVTFTLPQEAAFGYYYAFVFRRANTKTDLAAHQTAVVGGTATLVLLEAQVPNAERKIEVSEFSTDHSVYEFLPVTFTVALKNTGNVHVAPRGNIFLSRGSNKNLALLELNPEKGNILPQSIRTFESRWKDGFPIYEQKIEDGEVAHDENGNQVMKLTWNFDNAAHLRMGKYTAKMLLAYDDGTRDVPIEGVLTFWVIPWRLLVGVGFIALFFFVGMKSSIMRLWRFFFKKTENTSISSS